MFDFLESIHELFIIGNGFDIAHNLPTSYWDFRLYLEKKDEEFLVDFERLFGIEPLDDGHFHSEKSFYESMEIRNYILKNTLWKSFENNLGHMHDQQILDFSSSIVDNLDLETGKEGILDTMNAYWSDQYGFIEKLQQLLKQWIVSIDIKEAPIIRNDLFESCELFLTFNYNLLLENVYNIESSNVLHIHGSIDDNDLSPVIGHGNYKKIEEYKAVIKQAINTFDETSESIYRALVKMYSNTLKDTYAYIRLHQWFFSKLEKVDLVSVIGHSFGEVDFPYFKTVKDSVKQNCEWKFYCFSEADIKACNDLITKLGLVESQYKMLNSKDFWI